MARWDERNRGSFLTVTSFWDRETVEWTDVDVNVKVKVEEERHKLFIKERTTMVAGIRIYRALSELMRVMETQLWFHAQA